MTKYVILLYFYIKVEQNYQQKKKKNTKNIKIQDQIRLKRIQQNTCIMRFQITCKQLKFQSNLR